MKKLQGKFIAFEGIDKCGKGTQIKLLKNFLSQLGVKSWFTFEPTKDWPFGQIIHFILKHHVGLPAIWLQYLYYLDRQRHVKAIASHLQQGEMVVCDRYLYSTLAYGYSGGVEMDKILAWHKGILKPDLVIYVDVSAQEAIRRLKAEKGKAELFEKEWRLRKVKEGYEKCFALFPRLFRRIDGKQSKERVFEEVKNVLALT